MTPDPPARDRRQLLLGPEPMLNGIDYVDVAASQTQLYVHFLNKVPMQGTLSGGPSVTISGGEVITTITVEEDSISWSADSEGQPVMAVTVAAPGDFATYQLTIISASLDPFFDSKSFTFKANCPATLDCAAGTTACPPEAAEPVPIDYLAKDFASFTQALSEFSALRYPGWVERSEADLGVVLMEVLAAMADELSYYQDRVLAESTIQTATQRLSAVRHARLVDFEPTPATVATTVLQLDVSGPAASPPRPAGRSIRRCWSARWERTGRRSTSRSKTRLSGWRLPGGAHRAPGRTSTPAGTGAASSRTTGTTASAACPPARPASTSAIKGSGSTAASSSCSTHPPRTAPIRMSVSSSPCRARP